MTIWPRQSECDAYYGNPRGRYGSHANPVWERENLVFVHVRFPMSMGKTPVYKILIHKKCADSLSRVLETAGIEKDAASFSGSYCYRLMRGSSHLSMHAYGAAIDFDAEHNAFHAHIHRFQFDSPLVQAFEREGWIWGGRWQNPDAMHFQAARL